MLSCRKNGIGCSSADPLHRQHPPFFILQSFISIALGSSTHFHRAFSPFVGVQFISSGVYLCGRLHFFIPVHYVCPLIYSFIWLCIALQLPCSHLPSLVADLLCSCVVSSASERDAWACRFIPHIHTYLPPHAANLTFVSLTITSSTTCLSRLQVVITIPAVYYKILFYAPSLPSIRNRGIFTSHFLSFILSRFWLDSTIRNLLLRLLCTPQSFALSLH